MSSEKIFRRISGIQKTHPTDGFACYQPYECVEDYALSTAPDLKHLVQTCMDFVTPLTFYENGLRYYQNERLYHKYHI